MLFLQFLSASFGRDEREMERTIDIDKILQNKMGTKAKLVPHIAVNYLKRIIHQDQVNGFLWDSRDKVATEWLEACMRYLDITLEVKGLENLPDDADGKRYTFVSNHPLGGIDGVALGSIIGRHYNNRFRYLVNDLLMYLPGLAPLCIAINTTGSKSRNFPAMVEEGFRGDHHILMFPAGLCSRKTRGKVCDLAWKKAFITKSIETKRDVVPIHFEGHNSDFFYRLANICKALHIKFNVAMLFLVDEMYKNTHQTFRVTIGKPIPWQTFDRTRTAQQWAQYVKNEVYKLSQHI